MIGSHVSPVLSYPIQRTLYRVVVTLTSSTCLWKSSPIPTICSGIHCIQWTIFLLCKFIPTTSKCDVVVRRESTVFPWVRLKVGSFGFSDPVRRVRCGGLVSTDCVRWWLWCVFLCVTTVFVSTLSRYVLKTRISRKASFTLFFCFEGFWSGESWEQLERLGEKWWKILIFSDNQAETCLIVTINDASSGDFPWLLIDRCVYWHSNI